MTSIRRWLLAALLAALALAGLAAATATYISARDEVDDLLDEELRQVALSLRDHAVLDLRRLESVAANPAQRVLVQIWDPAFDRPYVSRVVGTGPMPRTDEGYATVLHDARPWRVFTLFTGRQLIQVAQPTALRTELAARTAARLLLPVLIVLPFLGLAGWWIVGRGLAPLGRIAGDVKQRSPTALTPLETAGMPSEIRPLADALNDLLARLDQSFTQQTPLRRRCRARAAHAAHGAEPAGAVGRARRERRGQSTRIREAATGPASGHATGPATADDGATRARRCRCRADARRCRQAADFGHRGSAPARVPNARIRVTGQPLRRDCDRRRQRRRAAHPVQQPGGQRDPLYAGRRHSDRRRSARRRRRRSQLEDTGPGIPEDERARVFDRFYRGPTATATGTGLGLAIVSQVVGNASRLSRARRERRAAGSQVRVPDPSAAGLTAKRPAAQVFAHLSEESDRRFGEARSAARNGSALSHT